MNKSTKIIIKNILNNEKLYTITKSSKYKLREIQKKYELLRLYIDKNVSRDKINYELLQLLEKENEYFATRTEEIVTFTINHLKMYKF